MYTNGGLSIGKIVFTNPLFCDKLNDKSAKYISSCQGVGEMVKVNKLNSNQRKITILNFIAHYIDLYFLTKGNST